MPRQLRLRSTDLPEDIDIIKLRQDLDTHLEDYAMHKDEILNKAELIARAQEANIVAIAALTKATAGVVEAWVVIEGFHRFVKWVSSFAVLGVILSWVVSKLPANFFQGP